MNLHDHDPEPNAKTHYQDIVILSMLQTHSRALVPVLVCKSLFGWNNDQALERVRDLKENCFFLDGQIIRRTGDGFYLETGDRLKHISRDGETLDPFFDNATPERRAELLRAMAHLKDPLGSARADLLSTMRSERLFRLLKVYYRRLQHEALKDGQCDPFVLVECEKIVKECYAEIDGMQPRPAELAAIGVEP